MTSKKSSDIIPITPLEETHPLVMILWTDNTYNKKARKTFFYDKYIIHNFKLSKYIAEKTNASVKKFEKTISEVYCDKCTVWESFIRADELKTIIEESYDTKGRFSILINNVCSKFPIIDMDDQNVICIDLRRPEAIGKEKVYFSNGTTMKFGKAADREAYSEYKYHMINGLKKYHSKSIENIDFDKIDDLVEKIKQLTSNKKTLEDVSKYYHIIVNYKHLNVYKIKSFEELKEKTADVMYSQRFIQQTYNKLAVQAAKNTATEAQRKNLVNGGYDKHFPSL